MSANRKKLGLLLIIVGAILLGLIIYFAFIKKAPSTTPTTPSENPIIGQLPPVEPTPTTPGDRPRKTTYDVSKETPHKINAADLEKIAMAFAERFGSFSVDSNYGNFTDLKLSMTESFKNWVDTYVAGLKEKNKNVTGYYGITTSALTTEVKSFNDQAGTAEIVVTTERSESKEEINGGATYQQKITLKFLKVNNEWLVDEAYWEK